MLNFGKLAPTGGILTVKVTAPMARSQHVKAILDFKL
jgi:hypothetical protein